MLKEGLKHIALSGFLRLSFTILSLLVTRTMCCGMTLVVLVGSLLSFFELVENFP